VTIVPAEVRTKAEGVETVRFTAAGVTFTHMTFDTSDWPAESSAMSHTEKFPPVR